jgi:phage shock protein C
LEKALMSQLYERKNPHRLFRDRDNAMLAGVCAGVAEYFGLNRKGVRLATLLVLLFPPFFAFVVVSYVVLAIVLPLKPADLYESPEHRFRELNLRLERLEAHVTSKEFQIDRELERR